MAWMLRGYIDVCWVPEGVGGVALQPQGGQANEPGYGANLSAGTFPNAQTLRLQIAEPIVGHGSTVPTGANLNSAATQLGTDLGTFLNNNLAQIQNWYLGQP